MRLLALPTILLVFAASCGNATTATTSQQSSVTATAAAVNTTTVSLTVITPETPASQSKTGRAFYVSDEDYEPPAGGHHHSAYEVAATYPAGHSAHDEGTWMSSDDHHHDHKTHDDVDTIPYHSYHSASGLHNPSHDPTLYQTFVPHYVSTGHGHHHHHPAAGHDIDMPTYVVPATWPSASAPLAVHDYILHPAGTGPPAGADHHHYEHEHHEHEHDHHDDDDHDGPHKNDSDDRAVALLATVVPRSVALVLVRSVGFMLSSLGIVLFGGVVTSAVCALTPLCTLTITLVPLVVGLRKTASSTLQKVLGGPFDEDGAEGPNNVSSTVQQSVNSRKDDDGASLATSNNRIASRAVRFVGSAIDKYEKMQE